MRIRFGGREIVAEPDDTILAAVKRAEKNIFSICGGRGACGTCRVAVAADWLDRLPPPANSETRLLRVLKAGKANHRLACQTILNETHDGLEIFHDPPPSKILTRQETET